MKGGLRTPKAYLGKLSRVDFLNQSTLSQTKAFWKKTPFSLASKKGLGGLRRWKSKKKIDKSPKDLRKKERLSIYGKQ